MALPSTFPLNLPGTSIEVDISPEYATEIHEAVSGKEDRASWRTQSRIRYVIRFPFLRVDTMAPSPNGSVSEYALIRGIVDDLKGAHGQISLVDPEGAGTNYVRLASDSVKFRQILPHIYSTELELITVL